MSPVWMLNRSHYCEWKKNTCENNFLCWPVCLSCGKNGDYYIFRHMHKIYCTATPGEKQPVLGVP